jgi:hypothetical protein
MSSGGCSLLYCATAALAFPMPASPALVVADALAELAALVSAAVVSSELPQPVAIASIATTIRHSAQTLTRLFSGMD